MNDMIERADLTELATSMTRHGTDRDAPVREVMGLLGDRWTTLILLVLGAGEWRHAELRRTLARLSSEQSISQRVLTLKLRTLERDGMVARTVSADVPPKVSYRLTPLGAELLCQVRSMIGWIEDHYDMIVYARAEFDSLA